jgi:dihydrofolate reductase
MPEKKCKRMTAIAVVDRNWGIGRSGGLLAHLPGDLKFFRQTTLGQVVVMGRKTLESLPGGKPLDGRDTLVLSRNPEQFFPGPGIEFYDSIDAMLSGLSAAHAAQTVYVCGGEEIYRLLLPYCDQALITKMDAVFDADVHFPNLDSEPDFDLVNVGDKQIENSISYCFSKYRRVQWDKGHHEK